VPFRDTETDERLRGGGNTGCVFEHRKKRKAWTFNGVPQTSSYALKKGKGGKGAGQGDPSTRKGAPNERKTNSVIVVSVVPYHAWGKTGGGGGAAKGLNREKGG